VVSDRGAEHHAYGQYVGYSMGGRSFFGGGGVPDEILIFRDALVRDFGDDPERLRSQVIETSVTRSGTTSVWTRRMFADSACRRSRPLLSAARSRGSPRRSAVRRGYEADAPAWVSAHVTSIAPGDSLSRGCATVG
jgi:hypothetical protein